MTSIIMQGALHAMIETEFDSLAALIARDLWTYAVNFYGKPEYEEYARIYAARYNASHRYRKLSWRRLNRLQRIDASIIWYNEVMRRF